MGIELEIRQFHSPDVSDLARWKPLALADVYVLIELDIGEHGIEGTNIFTVVVATPEALRARASASFVLTKRATLVVAEYSWRSIAAALEEVVNTCRGDSWAASVEKLQRFFRWEYEDYVLVDS